MKKVFVLIPVMLVMTLLIACSSDDENNQQNEENDKVTNEDNGNNNNDDGSDNDNGKFGDGEILSLGETGKVESTTGDYEVTFESFQLLDEIDGEEAIDSNVLVLVDARVEVTGDDPLGTRELYSAKLFNEESNAGNTSYFDDSINRIGDLEPGESEEGQFIFEIDQGDSYELVLNYGLDGVATEITWEFDADEASN